MTVLRDLEGQTLSNGDFRRVLDTVQHSQLVLMTIAVGSEIGEEVHDDVDQTLVIVAGEAEVTLDGDASAVSDGDAVIVHAGVRHNVVNRGDEPLRLYTMYAPPEHPDGTVHATKAEADAAEHH